ncbi:acyl carrier protein [Robiginitalea myxolifaciens]|uniref:Acyl carrier protein n=1 Tax=Robiginitalea myxolifaciens TaxID=400055 RepID=A0A1I6GYZ1_9FLAO|nr:phosphopantetheine-binding protein [Robiginitalea myxolifaciens]SFR47287.1 acyl carrier protein [Robiginitalea myxolifaciens]
MKDHPHYNTLRELIAPYLPEDVSLDSLQPDSNLISELNINSSHLVDLVLDIEDQYDIRLEDTEMQQMQTVTDALHLIDNKLKAKES